MMLFSVTFYPFMLVSVVFRPVVEDGEVESAETLPVNEGVDSDDRLAVRHRDDPPRRKDVTDRWTWSPAAARALIDRRTRVGHRRRREQRVERGDVLFPPTGRGGTRST
jgi:hypothetical protein